MTHRGARHRQNHAAEFPARPLRADHRTGAARVGQHFQLHRPGHARRRAAPPFRSATPNPNTAEGIRGRHTAIATEQVHHRPGALSRVVLPVK
jgi:hypothetical protein